MNFNLPLSAHKDIEINTDDKSASCVIRSYPGVTLRLTAQELRSLIGLLVIRGEQILRDIGEEAR